MKRLLRDTAGKSGLEYLLIVTAIGTLGAVPFWAFGMGMDKTISDTTHASALPALGSQSMAHTANQVEGMCYVQTFAGPKSNAERHGADVSASGFDDVYVVQSGGYDVTRIRVPCDEANNTLERYLALGITNDAFIGYLPKSDNALFGGGNTPAPDSTPAADHNSGSGNANAGGSEQLELPLDDTASEPTPEPDVNGGGAGPANADSDVGSSSQAGAGLPARDVSSNPMQQALNEILELSDEELEALIAQKGTTPAMEALINSFYADIPEECFADQELTEECANNQEVQAVLQMADDVYYTLLSEAASELTYREFGSMSEAELTQSIQDAQMILEECTALSPAPAFTEEGYPAVNESCQNEKGEQFYADFASAIEGVQTEEAYMQAMESFARTDIAGQCWATQNQPTYDENGMMAATEACAGSETKMNAFMDAQLNGEALKYTLERQTFEDMFGPDAYEGSHSLQLLEYDDNGQLVRSERLYKQAESMGLVEPGAFEAAVAQDQAQLEELQGGEQPQVGEEPQAESGDEGGGGGFFGGLKNMLGKVQNVTKWLNPVAGLGNWLQGTGIPGVSHVGNLLNAASNLSPLGLLRPKDQFEFFQSTFGGLWGGVKDIAAGVATGVGQGFFGEFLWGQVLHGKFGEAAGSIGNALVKTPGALVNGVWSMAKNGGTCLFGGSTQSRGNACGRIGLDIALIWSGGKAVSALKKGTHGLRGVQVSPAVTEANTAMSGARAAVNEAIEKGVALGDDAIDDLVLSHNTATAGIVGAKAPTVIGRTRVGMWTRTASNRLLNTAPANAIGSALSPIGQAAGRVGGLWNRVNFGVPQRAGQGLVSITRAPNSFGKIIRPGAGVLTRHPLLYGTGSALAHSNPYYGYDAFRKRSEAFLAQRMDPNYQMMGGQ